MGNFSINYVRTGNYNLYAWVPGFIGDYRNEVSITITPGLISICSSFNTSIILKHANIWAMWLTGSDIDMGEIVYVPPRDGPTLWEIGVPDRSAAEYYVPDPDPKYINKLYVNHPDKLVYTCIILFLCVFLYLFHLAFSLNFVTLSKWQCVCCKISFYAPRSVDKIDIMNPFHE